MFDVSITDPKTQTIQKTFDILQAVGNAANGGDADEEALRQACSLLQQQGTLALRAAIDDRAKTTSLLSGFQDSRIGSLAYAQGRSALAGSISSACAALTGQNGGEITLGIDPLRLKEMALGLAYDKGLGFLKNSGLPLTSRLEVSGTVMGRGASDWEILTVQPLWHDASAQNHVFTQLSWNHTEGRDGYARGNTLNAGLAWRRLSEDRSVVYGVNAFLDHARDMNHNRMSIGADVQTSQLGASVNRYIPLSDWKSVDSYTEERASRGWDLELQGRVPQLPSWQMNLKGYQWSSNLDMEEEDTYGYNVGVQWQPVNALVWEAGVQNEQDASPQMHTQMRLVYKFGMSIEEMWKQPVKLASMEERVYDKVRRENAIRVTQRTKDSAYVRVEESIGNNTASLADGTSVSVFVNQELPRPFTINVSAVGGSIVRMVFRDGAILTIGAGSQVRVEAESITLISGLFQYVSGATNVIINVPGGSVTLLGTDVDVSTNGTTSVLRVRDGAAVLTGTAVGAATVNAGGAAETVSGTVGALNATDANFITHTDDVSTKIDRVAAAQSGDKVTPYASEVPRMTTTTTTTGQPIGIALKFNIPVSVNTGGGTPQLTLNINGNTRQAICNGGTGTDELNFTYTLQAGDAGTNLLTVQALDLNGGTIAGNSKNAVTTVADIVLNMTGASDIGVPTGYAVSFTTDPISASNYTAAAFQITGGEVGSSYDYTISSNNGGTNVTGTGTITTATQSISGLDLSGLNDGTLTVSITLTDIASNVGAAATDTVVKDVITLALNFAGGAYSLNGTSYGSFTAIPGATFTRASPATTYAENSSGTLVAFAANTPRVTDKGILIEASRTNYSLNSNDFTTGAVPLNVASIVASAATGPDGTMSASEFTAQANSGFQYQGATGVPDGKIYTGSVWLKAGTLTEARIQLLATGAGLSFTSKTVTLTNNWQRFEHTINLTGVAGGDFVRFRVMAPAASPGTFYAAFRNIEEGSFASSYIPTAGAAVTRSADFAQMSGLSVFPNYSAFAEFEYRSESEAGPARLIGMQNSAPRSSVVPLSSTSLTHTAFNTVDGNTAGAVGTNQTIRRIAGVSTTSPPVRRIVADGGTVTGDNGTTPMTSTINIGSENSTVNHIETYLRDIRIYPSALTDAQLQTLTTP